MNQPLTLYLSKGACSMAPHIALLEAGAEFTPAHISLSKGEQHSPEFRKVNPRGLVPVLKIGDEVLVENLAILVWIARNYPDARLLPARTPVEEIQMLSYLSWCTGTLHTAFSPLFHPEKFVSGEAGVESLKENAREQVHGHFTEIEQRLSGRDWAFGEFSVIDAFLFVAFHWASAALKLDVSNFPHYQAHYDRMRERPSVASVLEAESDLAKAA